MLTSGCQNTASTAGSGGLPAVEFAEDSKNGTRSGVERQERRFAADASSRGLYEIAPHSGPFVSSCGFSFHSPQSHDDLFLCLAGGLVMGAWTGNHPGRRLTPLLQSAILTLFGLLKRGREQPLRST